MDPDRGPYELQAKVQFDIRYYFARRGGENIYNMTKETFKCITDRETGISYVTRVQGEETKNHKEGDNEIISGYMPELPGSKYCPVQSYLTYTISLDRNSPYLWQWPKFNIFPVDGKGTWYGPRRVGHNPIDNFITELAKNYRLQDLKYTNHSFRVTSITTLTHDQFSNKQIMALTGHKSEASLAIYQRVNSNEKIWMGFSLCNNLLDTSKAINSSPQQLPNLPALPAPAPSTLAIALPPPQKPAIQEFPMKANVNSETALVPFEPNINEGDLWDNDFDLMAAIAETQQAESDMRKTNKTTTVSKQICEKKQPNHTHDVQQL